MLKILEKIEKTQKKDDEIEKNKKAREILETRLAQKTEEINRMVKQGSVELQGEVQEERLQDYLEKIFPKMTLCSVCHAAPCCCVRVCPFWNARPLW